MDPAVALPNLLAIAWLLPLASFTLIVFLGPRMGHAGKHAGTVATGAILASCLLSLVALFGVWLPHHGTGVARGHGGEHAAGAHSAMEHAPAQQAAVDSHAAADSQAAGDS